MNVNKREKSKAINRRIFAAVMAAAMVFGAVAGVFLALHH